MNQKIRASLFWLTLVIPLASTFADSIGNVHLRGVVVPERQVNMAMSQTGILDFIAASGSVVKKGEVLAQIDPAELQAQLKQAKALFQSADAEFAAANHSLEKTRRLVGEDILSDIALTEAQFAVRTAEAAVEVNRSKYQLAQLSVAQSTLFAPFDGVVADTKVSEGEWVQKADPVILFASMDALMMSTDIPPEFTDTLKVGSETAILFQGQVIGKARVKRLFPMLQPASGLRRIVWAVEVQQSVLISGRYVELAPWF